MKLLIISILMASVSANAAIDRKTIEHNVVPRKAVLSEKKNIYLKSGIFFGGEGGTKGYSLVDMRRKYSPKDQIDRVILEMGDAKGLPTAKIGYFQVSVNKDTKRIDIDLSQMSGAKIDQKKIEALFEKSPLVQSAKINYDPEDAGIVIQLQLVASSNVEVFKTPVTKKDPSGRIIVDIKKTR